MKLYQKKMLTWAEPITDDNLYNLEIMGATIATYNERSIESFQEHAKVGQVVIWTQVDPEDLTKKKIRFAECKTIEGLHTAELPSRLMKPQNGGHPYFCTEKVFQETYIYSGKDFPVIINSLFNDKT